MAPKKATGTAAAKKATPPEHAPYKDMIRDAILSLKERNGSSRQAIKKYVLNNNKGIKTSNFSAQFNAALKRGVTAGDFLQPKGPSGPVKLQKKELAKTAKSGEKPATAAPKKSTTTTTTKKATPAKPVAKPKKATATSAPKSTTANTKKPRKTTATEKPAIKKTKTGKVTKTTGTTKKATAPKKAPSKKKKADAATAPAAASE